MVKLKLQLGFLKDGMNLKTNDYVFSVGGERPPIKTGFEDFALKLSNYIDQTASSGFNLLMK